MTAPAPAQVKERYDHIDMLRGLALFGMLAVHFHTHYQDGSSAVADIVIPVLFQTKFYALFAFLFGAGFALQQSGARAGFAVRFLRRTVALALIAVAVWLLLGYRVLLMYACFSVPLLIIGSLRTRWIACAFVLSLLFAGTIWEGVSDIASRITRGAPTVVVPAVLRVAEVDNTGLRGAFQQRATGTFRETVRARATIIRWEMSQRFWWLPDMQPFGYMLLGILAVRTGVLLRPHEHRRTIGIVMTIAFIMGFSGSSHFWMLIYAGALLLWGQQAVAALRYSGRMALSNYVLQLVFLELVFGRHGLNVPMPGVLAVPAAVVVTAAQIEFSRRWLQHFRMGPLEWVWRLATYGPVQTREVAARAVIAG